MTFAKRSTFAKHHAMPTPPKHTKGSFVMRPFHAVVLTAGMAFLWLGACSPTPEHQLPEQPEDMTPEMAGPVDQGPHAKDLSAADSDAHDGGGGADASPPLSSCTTLFGAPNENTGLDDSQCSPVCEGCAGGFAYTAGSIDAATLERWRQLEHDPPFQEITTDPYLEPAPEPAPPGTVCGVLFSDDTRYTLTTFASSREAMEAGAIPTHSGACGVCSTLGNLAVYAGNGDLTSPVRECGLVGVRDGEEANIACLQELGFDLPCAQIWYYNTNYTRQKCGRPCFAALNDPYHFADGRLNDCLQCDEDNAGPVFKAYAGRTRRNSGLATAICRPCEGLFPANHSYP